MWSRGTSNPLFSSLPFRFWPEDPLCITAKQQYFLLRHQVRASKYQEQIKDPAGKPFQTKWGRRDKRSETNRKQHIWHKKSRGNGKMLSFFCLLISPFFFPDQMMKLSEFICQAGIIRHLQENPQNLYAGLRCKVHTVAKIPHDVRSLLQNGTNLHPGPSVASPEAKQKSFYPSNCTKLL